MNRWLPVAALLATACWTTEFPELPDTALAFAPSGAEAPDGWIVQAWPQGDMIGPDGAPARFWLVHPEEASAPMPMAVVFHDNAFDYSNNEFDPGTSAWRTKSQLTSDHATRAVFNLLGMGIDDGTGALVAALASAGHQVILPSNCWGDLYANSIDDRPNDQAGEGFARRGYSSAEFGWLMTSDEAWPTINRIALPVPVDFENPVAIGIGHGGRAIGELLAEEAMMPLAITDASLDSVAPYYDDPGQFPNEVAALQRIFADRADAALGSVANAPVLPARFAYLYSQLDPAIPASAHTAALERLDGEEGAWVLETGSTQHAPLSDDPELAAAVTAWIAAR